MLAAGESLLMFVDPGAALNDEERDKVGRQWIFVYDEAQSHVTTAY